jgi:Icc-related predicted phosphoesterase
MPSRPALIVYSYHAPEGTLRPRDIRNDANRHMVFCGSRSVEMLVDEFDPPAG